MIGVAGFVGTFVVAVVALTIWGSSLDRNHVVARTAVYPAPREVVWQTITDFESAPSWRTGVYEVSVQDSGEAVHYTETSEFGELRYIVREQTAPRRLVTEIVADDTTPIAGTWTWVLEERGPEETQVTITERGTVEDPMFRFLVAYVMGHTATVDTVLTDLGRRYGAAVVPRDAPPAESP